MDGAPVWRMACIGRLLHALVCNLHTATHTPTTPMQTRCACCGRCALPRASVSSWSPRFWRQLQTTRCALCPATAASVWLVERTAASDGSLRLAAKVRPGTAALQLTAQQPVASSSTEQQLRASTGSQQGQNSARCWLPLPGQEASCCRCYYCCCRYCCCRLPGVTPGAPAARGTAGGRPCASRRRLWAGALGKHCSQQAGQQQASPLNMAHIDCTTQLVAHLTGSAPPPPCGGSSGHHQTGSTGHLPAAVPVVGVGQG